MTLAVIAVRRGRLLRRDHQRHAPADRAARRARSRPVARLVDCLRCRAAVLAVRVYLGRFEQLFDDHGGAIFTGVTYTDANVRLTGMLVVAGALVLGARDRARQRGRRAQAALARRGGRARGRLLLRRRRDLGWYVNGFIVKPNELVRETPYIAHNIEITRKAYGLDRVRAAAVSRRIRRRGGRRRQQPGDAPEHPPVGLARAPGHAPPDPGDPHLLRISRHRHRSLQIDGTMRQMMLAARELNVERLPESSRNWINEKLIYTHGYGVTMNPVNGFTSEGMPELVLSNMPVESTHPGPEGDAAGDLFRRAHQHRRYVKTRQQEFNYPQGDTNSLTSYEGTGGIVLGGFLRRLLIALDRGDITKLPFSDDISPDSRLLMRRNIRERVARAGAVPHLRSRSLHRRRRGRPAVLDAGCVHDVRHLSVRAPLRARAASASTTCATASRWSIDAYDGTTTFYVFDTQDPIIAAYRAIFPTPVQGRERDAGGAAQPRALSRAAAAAAGRRLRPVSHDRPSVFYNREDLWTRREPGQPGQPGANRRRSRWSRTSC